MDAHLSEGSGVCTRDVAYLGIRLGGEKGDLQGGDNQSSDKPSVQIRCCISKITDQRIFEGNLQITTENKKTKRHFHRVGDGRSSTTKRA